MPNSDILFYAKYCVLTNYDKYDGHRMKNKKKKKTAKIKEDKERINKKP